MSHLPKITRLLLLLVVGVLARQAAATVVVPYSLEDLTDRSDLVVEGDVVSLVSAFDPDQGRIMTRVSLEVSRCFKGACSKSGLVSFDTLGGIFENFATRVQGEAEFAEGERVLVFLEAIAPSGRHMVTGMTQGKFTIHVDATTRTVVATRRFAHLHFIQLAEPPFFDQGAFEIIEPKPIESYDYHELIRLLEEHIHPENIR